MPWTRVGDILAVYNSSTLVAGDASVIAAWPGAEAAGYPDDEYDLPGGTVMIFDLNLLRPVVFAQRDTLRLLASFSGLGSKNIDDAILAAALSAPVSDEVWGTFEVTSGALVVANTDLANPAAPAERPTHPTLVGKHTVVMPCSNGTYEVTGVTKVEAPSVSRGMLLQLAIRSAV